LRSAFYHRTCRESRLPTREPVTSISSADTIDESV
jgi:hypothetical protein